MRIKAASRQTPGDLLKPSRGLIDAPPGRPRGLRGLMDTQTLTFLNAWSLTVYAVAASASYLAAMGLIAEPSYGLAVPRAPGAKNSSSP
ncbi:MAG: hypothetical protein ABWK01_06740 [Infirmifilum sp.]